MTTDYTQWGLLPGETPAGAMWAGVLDSRRSLGAKGIRTIGYVLLPSALRRSLMPPNRSFIYTLTTTDTLVFSGLAETPLRLPSGSYRLHDTGDRLTMRTIVRGKLARVVLETASHGDLHLLLQADSLEVLTR